MRRGLCAAGALVLSLLLAPQSHAQSPSVPHAVVDPASVAEVTSSPAPQRRRQLFLEGDGWVPYALGTGALLATDRLTQPFLTNATAGSTTRRVSEAASFLGTPSVYLGTPLALYALGGSRGRRTATNIVNALVTSGALTQAVKNVGGRRRPDQSGGVGDFRGPSTRYESFPSGHTSAAFATATVLASEYPRHRTAIYGLAVAVAASRVLLNHHFPSDVLVGGVIGVASGQNALNGGGNMLGFRF